MSSASGSGASRFLQENGWFLFLRKLPQTLTHRLRNLALGQTLRVAGLNIGPHARITGVRHLRLGTNFSAGRHLWLDAITNYEGEAFDPLITIGDNCNLSESVHIACTNRVTIGSGFLSGSNVIVTDHAHGVYRGQGQSSPSVAPQRRTLSRMGNVFIGDNVWLGDGAAVLAGANIGDGCIVGANSVVNGTLPPRTVCVGAPARPIRQWDESQQSWQPL